MASNSWQHALPAEKIITTRKAIACIRNGCRVFLGTGCGEPQHLIHAMVADKGTQDIMIYQMLSFTNCGSGSNLEDTRGSTVHNSREDETCG